jgi:rhomboid family GlyGly-CTERM serine protease
MSFTIKKIKFAFSKSVRRAPYVTLLLTLTALLTHLSYSLRLQLLYDRSALLHHELWRLMTCHWVHLSWDHLLWSAMTFLGLGSICEMMDGKKILVTVGLSALLIPITIWWGMPDLKIYGGLSGLDCALYALLMVLLIKREIRSGNRVWLAFFSLMLAGLIAKIIYETVTGMTIFVSNNHAGMVPVPLAHLVGGIVGIGVGLIKNTTTASGARQQEPGLRIPDCQATR